MVTDLMPLPVNALQQPWVSARLGSHNEECGGSMVGVEYVEYLRSPLRVWSVIERNRDSVVQATVLAGFVRSGEMVKFFPVDQAASRVKSDRTVSVGWLRCDGYDFSRAFIVDFVPGRHAA